MSTIEFPQFSSHPFRGIKAVVAAHPLALPAAIAVASRVFSSVLLVIYSGLAARLPLLTDYKSAFTAWDGQWYLHIAQTGYHAEAIQAGPIAGGHHDFAFYPGWPLLIKVVSLNGTLAMDWTAVVLANFLFVLAAMGVYALFLSRFNSQTALWGTVLLCFNPVSYVYSMAFSESLFLLLAVLYFLDRYGNASPVLAALAMFTRVTGLAIAASAAAMLLLRRGPRLRLFLVCVAVGLVFAGWWIYIWQLTGDFKGWFLGSPSWSKYSGPTSIVHLLVSRPPFEIAWLGFTALMLIGCLLLVRRHPDLAIYGLVAIAMSLIAAPGSSMPRHSLAAFPAFAGIADRIGLRWSRVLTVAFMIGEVAFVQFAFGIGHRPP